jgi:hypothetical protein
MENRIYPDGVRVEVWREARREWVRGAVLQGRQRDDGTWEYFVQLTGYHAMDTADPTHWSASSRVRAARF